MAKGSRVFHRILFVCVGNVCRSPTAAALLQRRLERDDPDIGSAGLHALVGQPIDPTAHDVLRAHGGDADAHRARQLDRALLAASDLILVMERSHAEGIVRPYPEVSGRTFLLGKWRGDLEIPDPYRQRREAFEHVYGLIDDCVSAWLPYLRAPSSGATRPPRANATP